MDERDEPEDELLREAASGPRPEPEEAGEGQSRARRKIAESLLDRLLEGGAAIRRGQDVIGGVAQGTKEEVLRIVGSEVRGFLDKIDVVDLMQQVVSGLVIDVEARVKIGREDGGGVETSTLTRKLEVRRAASPGRAQVQREADEDEAEDEDEGA